ncbi:MAG: hypothetical protein PHT33_10125 [bacterium]|nr:hypothetical protein [bacterium]
MWKLISYAKNQGFTTGWTGCKMPTLADFKQPAETMLVMDSAAGSGFTMDYSTYLPNISNPHSEGTNVLFVGGNVKWMKCSSPTTDFASAKVGVRFWKCN